MSPLPRLMVLRVVPVALVAAHVLGVAARVTAVAASPAAPARVPPSAPEVSSTGACPSADKIWTAMATLVPRGALDALPRSASVDVADLGETYRVRLTAGNNQRVRVYRDLARDCEQRARFAAVFVVLTLMPPELLIDSPPKLPPPEPEAPRLPPAELVATVAVAPPPTRRLRLELTAVGDTAPAVLSAPEMTSPGGELRAAIGGGRLAALFAVGLQPRTDFTVGGGVRARELRVPIDAGVRLRQVGRWLELDEEASLVVAIFRAEGVSPVVPKAATRVDLGLRAGIVLRIGGRDARLAPIVGLHTDYFPRPYDLATTPAGIIAQTPSLRLGATAGLAASF